MRSATLSLFWLRVSKRQNLKLAHIQADLWPNAVLTEISKDKHPQKKFITAFIPLQRADYKISAYTSLTVLALLLVKKSSFPPVSTHDFQTLWFLPSCHPIRASSLSLWIVPTIHILWCIHQGFTALTAALVQFPMKRWTTSASSLGSVPICTKVWLHRHC